ncbi:hypothetical protein LCGC14_0326170 [marine sediment metagenome]|uniref:Uncharacterized protein n=1 Tax=marine sediment metagenome TaxID=412755 RepID=A0A0F9W582_9ZZZZ
MNQKDGGHAFPRTAANAADCSHSGMSLRDWFAGQALTGLSSCIGRHQLFAHDWETEHISKAAYILADAMLETREQ